METLEKIVIACVLIGVLVVPAMAGTEYLGGNPSLTVNISGTNEFRPNTEVQLTVLIKNTGINEDKYISSRITDRDDLPNTAKFLTVSLSPGNAPVSIKTDPQMLGDLTGASSVSAAFTTKIHADAQGGTYTIPVILNYSYLDSTSQYSMETMKYTYKSENITVNIPIIIKNDLSIDVLSAEPEHLNAGADGYLNIRINNTGSENGTGAIVRITRSGDSPIIPADNSVYIGDFPAGRTVSSRYKVSVSDSAEKQTYPVDVTVVYKNAEGDIVTSRTETVGIPVGGKADFAIVSTPEEIHPGSKKTITVEYKNTGGTPVYSAKARLSAVDPFSSTEDTAYIGDLQPDESRTVTYVVSVDRSATIKEYALDSEIRYRNALDETAISDVLKVRTMVTAPTGTAIILTNPIYLSIIAAVLIGMAYLFFHYYRKKQ